MEPTVPNHFVPALVSIALKHGVSPEQLFARAGQSLERARTPGAEFSVAETERLYETLRTLAAQPALALWLGREFDFDKLELLGNLIASCATPRASFQVLAEFKLLFHPLFDLRCEEREGRTTLRYASNDELPIGQKPYYAELLFSALVYSAQYFAHDSKPPSQVAFRHAEPSYLRDYERTFRCELLFEQPYDELRYDYLFLDRPWRESSATLPALRVEAERRLATRSGQPLVRQVRRLLHARLADADLTVEDVARALGLSSRSLQRGLAGEGTSFREVQGSVRHQRACELLVDTTLTIEAIAAQLGYRERSNFVRAFERWGGLSPSGYRKQQTRLRSGAK